MNRFFQNKVFVERCYILTLVLEPIDTQYFDDVRIIETIEHYISFLCTLKSSAFTKTHGSYSRPYTCQSQYDISFVTALIDVFIANAIISLEKNGFVHGKNFKLEYNVNEVPKW